MPSIVDSTVLISHLEPNCLTDSEHIKTRNSKFVGDDVFQGFCFATTNIILSTILLLSKQLAIDM